MSRHKQETCCWLTAETSLLYRDTRRVSVEWCLVKPDWCGLRNIGLLRPIKSELAIWRPSFWLSPWKPPSVALQCTLRRNRDNIQTSKPSLQLPFSEQCRRKSKRRRLPIADPTYNNQSRAPAGRCMVVQLRTPLDFAFQVFAEHYPCTLAQRLTQRHRQTLFRRVRYDSRCWCSTSKHYRQICPSTID